MVAKEWRDARWKFVAAAVLVLLAILVSPIPTPYKEIAANAPGQVAAYAVTEMWGTYTAGGLLVLLPLAALLGVALVSGESIFFLLSKPISRASLMLTKYLVCAGVLFFAAATGAGLVIVVATARGYPVGKLVDVEGVALSVLLIWLGALHVLGLALLASILFRNVLSSVVATVLALSAVAVFPNILNVSVIVVQWTLGVADCGFGNDLYIPCGLRYELLEKLRLYSYWYSEGLYTGKDLAPTNFLVSTIAAATTILGALWLFDRKAL